MTTEDQDAGFLMNTCQLPWTLTHSIHLNALFWPLWTVAIVAVSPTPVAREAVDSEHILRTDSLLPIAVLFQVALVLFPATLLGTRRDLDKVSRSLDKDLTASEFK